MPERDLEWLVSSINPNRGVGCLWTVLDLGNIKEGGKAGRTCRDNVRINLNITMDYTILGKAYKKSISS